MDLSTSSEVGNTLPGTVETPAHSTGLGRSPLSLVVALLFLLVSYSEVMETGAWKDRQVLKWDIAGYYHYLPALFIHHDLYDLTYIRENDPDIAVNDERSWFGINPVESTGRHYLKFTYGTALFELPFFLIAHWVASDPENGYRADGYSVPYQLSVPLSTILFVALGLFILRRYLLRYVGDLECAIALATLAFGTNLFFYSTFNAGMSHGYLFFLYAVVLERTDSWHRRPGAASAIAIGLAAGLITITRPVDGLVLLIPLLWNCATTEQARSKWRQMLRHKAHILYVFIAFIIPLLPQFIYWSATTGSFIHYSYEGEGFHFRPENIIDGLFSFRKGWFIYSPLVILGFIGMIWMIYRRSMISMILPVLVYFPLTIVVVFSWHQWWYGGGFGARPMVNSLPLLALPIAWLARLLLINYRHIWIAMVVVIFLGIRLNMFQQYQYEISLIHWDGMTQERYWEVFLKKDWESVPPFPYEE